MECESIPTQVMSASEVCFENRPRVEGGDRSERERQRKGRMKMECLEEDGLFERRMKRELEMEDLEEQIGKVKKELEVEVGRAESFGQGDVEPFVVMKCERLYRTLRALSKRKQELERRNIRRYSPSPKKKSRRVHRKKQENRKFRLGVDPSIDRTYSKDHLLETWTWNGRPLRILRADQDRDQVARLKRRIQELEKEIAQLRGSKTTKEVSSNIEDSWSEETKAKVANGEKKGDERVRARELAKQELERQAKELRKEYEHQSAVVVQSVFRGHLGRKKMKQAKARYQKQLREQGAEIIQSRFRGHLARSEVAKKRHELLRRKQESAAIVIQSQYRGKMARNILRNSKSEKEKRKAAATIIQAWWRGLLARHQVLQLRKSFLQDIQLAAAIMLQNAWRCYKARKEVNRLREIQRCELEEAAAIMLQAAWRGYCARKKQRRLKKQLEKVENARQSMEWVQRVQSQYYSQYFLTLQQRAAGRIQAFFRGFRDRKRLGKEKRKLPDELEKTSPGPKGREALLVFSGIIQIPVQRKSGKQDVIDASVAVKEGHHPYQLQFNVKELENQTCFQRVIDADMLEVILRPLFDRAQQQEPQSKWERYILRWVKTGNPPPRKHLISWLLDRLWLDHDNELCMGRVIREPVTDDIDTSNSHQLIPSPHSLHDELHHLRNLDALQQENSPSAHNALPARTSPRPAKAKASTRTRDAFTVRYLSKT